MVFQWLVAHRGVAVGTWLQFGGRPPDCTGCGHPQESQRHCLWDCPLAQQVWTRLLRLASGEYFTWGAVAWGTLAGCALGYETEADSRALRGQQLEVVPCPDFSSRECSLDRDQRWELISSLGMWFVWRARCRRIFEGRTVPAAETVRDFWVELIHTLCGQYEQLQGDSESRQGRRRAFLQRWGTGPFFFWRAGSVLW